MERDRDGSVRVFQPPGERNALGQNPLQLPEQIPGLPARHAGEELLRPRQARLQPRLQARAGPVEICRGAAVLCIAESQLHRGQHQADARRRGKAARLPDPDPGPPHLPDRVRRRAGQAAIPRGHLRPGRQADVDPHGAASGRWPTSPSSGRPIPNFKPTAEQGQKLSSAAGGGGGSPFSLFEQLFR